MIEFTPDNIAVYQNTLSGDGVLSMMDNGCGVQIGIPGVSIGSVNVAINDNDISNVPAGVSFVNQDVGSFDMICDNSFHGDADGINFGVSYSDSAYEQPVAWCVGNTIRGNIITGPAGPVNFTIGGDIEYATGINIAGGIGGGSDPGQFMMNILDGNIITGYHVGIAAVYSGGITQYAGVVDTVLANNFFSSDDEIWWNIETRLNTSLNVDLNPAAFTNQNYCNLQYNDDLEAWFQFLQTNQWQNY